jgi:hypothetical protein
MGANLKDTILLDETSCLDCRDQPANMASDLLPVADRESAMVARVSTRPLGPHILEFCPELQGKVSACVALSGR